MITQELIANSEILSVLTDEQKQAVIDMSKADEDIVIGDRIGKIYGDLDNDILATSGIAKNGTEKTYLYAKRVIGELKGKADSVTELEGKVATLTEEKATLEKALADGTADTETKKQLAQAKTDLADITKKYTELAGNLEREKAEHERALFDMRVTSEIEKATSGLKFKSTIPDSVRDVILRDVTAKLKATATETEQNGIKVLAFKGENGETLHDASLKLLTATDLVKKELEAMSVLDKRREAGGAGSKAGEGSDGSVLDLTGAKTQTEADALIHKSLVAQGLTRGSNAYQAAMDKAWKDNGVSKLPIK